MKFLTNANCAALPGRRSVIHRRRDSVTTTAQTFTIDGSVTKTGA
jgi:hypothetical protein